MYCLKFTSGCTDGSNWPYRDIGQKKKYQQISPNALGDSSDYHSMNCHKSKYQIVVFSPPKHWSKSSDWGSLQKMPKNDFFFKRSFFYKNDQFLLTYVNNKLRNDKNERKKLLSGKFCHFFMCWANRVFYPLNLICIFKLVCPVKKLHGFARSETAIKSKIYVWSF